MNNMASESIIHQYVIKLLDAFARPDVVCFHPANGEKRDARTARRLKLMGVRPGVADLILLVDGKFHALELKKPKGRQSEAQTEFAQSVERAGGFYHIAYGLDEAIGVLRGINVLRRGVKIQFTREDVGFA